MNIELFNKTYTVRRFGEQQEFKGYLFSSQKDFEVNLHVHPLGSDQMLALPEGERLVKRLEAHSSTKLLVADQSKNQKGDLLLYKGEWYECISAQEFDHTILSHFNYQFVLVPSDASGSIDTGKELYKGYQVLKDDSNTVVQDDNCIVVGVFGGI